MKITTSLTRLAVIALFTALTPLVAQAEDGATKTTKNQNKTKRTKTNAWTTTETLQKQTNPKRSKAGIE